MSHETPMILLYRERYSKEHGYAPYGAKFEGLDINNVGRGETTQEAIINLLEESSISTEPLTRKPVYKRVPVYTKHAKELDDDDQIFVG
jgi:hypothetical protein